MQYARVVGPHVIGVRQSKVVIEAVLHRQKLFVMPQVPFAITSGGIALLLTDFSQSYFT